MSCLIWISAVCKSLLLSPMAVKELRERILSWEVTQSKLFFLFTEKVYSKRKEFGPSKSRSKFFLFRADSFSERFKFFPFRVDPFSEWVWPTEKQAGTVVSIYKSAKTYQVYATPFIYRYNAVILLSQIITTNYSVSQ